MIQSHGGGRALTRRLREEEGGGDVVLRGKGVPLYLYGGGEGHTSPRCTSLGRAYPSHPSPRSNLGGSHKRQEGGGG